jgi:hypothetical protein
MTTDDPDRLARLTELACSVWPGSRVTYQTAWVRPGSYASVVSPDGDEWLACEHARPLDALEAALLVLAGELETGDADAAFKALIDRSSLGTDEVKQACARTPPEVVDEILRRLKALAKVPAWAEELAQRWDAQAGHPSALQHNRKAAARHIWRQCAAELRARAKGGR